MAKDDDRAPVSGRPQIQRLYEGGADVADIGGMTRAERAAKYAADMKPQFDADLLRARGEGVAKFREGKSVPPDWKGNRWFRDEDWGPAKGGCCPYIGDLEWFETLHPEPEFAKEDARRQAEKIAKARAALGGVEAKLGVKPFGAPPVTKQTLADNKAVVDATKSLTGATESATESATKSRMGRPKKEHALTPTERARLARERKKPKGENP